MKNSSYFEGRSDAYRDAAEHLELVVKLSGGAFPHDVNKILLQLRHDYLMFHSKAEEAKEKAEICEDMDKFATLQQEELNAIPMQLVD